MAITVEMPRMSDTMEEGTLIKWHVSAGDTVEAGDVLADIETDKATQELTAFDDGKVAKLVAEEGQTLGVGSLILVLAEEGESEEDALANVDTSASGGGKAEGGKAKTEAGDEDDGDGGGKATATAEAPSEQKSNGKPAGDGRIRVSPVARKIAEEHGLDLGNVTGSGPSGRIIKRDVLKAVEGGGEAGAGGASGAPSKRAAAPTPQPAPKLEAKTIPLSNMRKTIARRLIESKMTIPHFTVTLSVDAAPMLEARQRVNASLEERGVKLSVNDFIVRAAVAALIQHPVVNSSWTDEGIRQPGTVSIGVAVALPEEKGGGLVVPVLRDAHTMGLRKISTETRRLAKKAREQGLTLEEMSDATFTVSNLGMFGVDHFEAIINPPQSAILAIGAALEKPVVRDGELTIGTEMTCTLSADHRVVDGATAAIFLQSLKQLLETPAMMLV